MIQGAEHGFDGKYHDETTRYGLDFLYRQFGIDRTEEHLRIRRTFLIASFALSIAAVTVCALIARKKEKQTGTL